MSGDVIVGCVIMGLLVVVCAAIIVWEVIGNEKDVTAMRLGEKGIE